MKEILKYISGQLDKLDEKLDSVDKTLVKQEANLQEHMRRTELLEKNYELLQTELYDELQPIKSHINQVSGITKFLLAFVPILATIAGLLYRFL